MNAYGRGARVAAFLVALTAAASCGQANQKRPPDGTAGGVPAAGRRGSVVRVRFRCSPHGIQASSVSSTVPVNRQASVKGPLSVSLIGSRDGTPA